jgi:hypothetical protein
MLDCARFTALPAPKLAMVWHAVHVTPFDLNLIKE